MLPPELRRGRERRRGASTLGCLTVVLWMALLLTAGIPFALRFLAAGTVEEIVTAVREVEAAAVGFRSETGNWPPHSPFGQPPGEIRSRLPLEVRFQGDGFDLSWQNWTLPTGIPGNLELEALAGVAVQVESEWVGQGLSAWARDEGRHWYRLGKVYTFFLEGP